MKNRRFKSLLSALLAVLMVFSCFVGVFAQEDENEPLSAYEAAVMKNAIARICIQMADTYYYGVTDEDLLYRALCSTIDHGSFDFDVAVSSMMKLLDDGYSEYYTPERFTTFYNDIAGEFYGIGVSITLSSNHAVVVNAFPDSPAEKAGILPYDTIISVDGKDISGMSIEDIATLIKREKGALVTLGIIRDGKTITVECFCDEVDQNPVSYEIMEDGKIGYIYVSTFSMNLGEFIEPVLKEFDEKGIKNIILDIRNNGGGELRAAMALAEYFIPAGVIAKLKYKNPENNSDVTVENELSQPPYNMVLLVNGYSASASELFAGAVKDRGAGTIIGTTTYGKGSMQSLFRLATGSGIKYTIAEFHSPNDTRIHTVGVTPDYVVENTSYTVTEDDFEPLVFTGINAVEEKTVLAVEQRLNSLGYDVGEPDTVFDEKTKDAVKSFQLVRNLQITGELDMYTLVAINDIVYEFEFVNDDQLEAAKNYILTGVIN